MVLDGAIKMLAAQTAPAAKSMVEMNIIESRRRLEFLEGELKKLDIKKHSQPGASTKNESATSQTSIPDSEESKFDLLRYEANITAEKVAFRLKETSVKLDFESRVKSGSENMINAFVKSGDVDPKRQQELEAQLSASKAKEQLLIKAKNRYAQLHVVQDEDVADEVVTHDTGGRKTGRLKLKLVEAVNITGRKSLKDEIICQVSIDGVVKFQSKPSKGKWDEQTDIQVDRGLELEIKVTEKNGTILALIWFRLADLVEDLDGKLGSERASNLEVPDTWLDLEPSGQILLKVNFTQASRAMTARDKVFRRDAVQKVYPRNGHRYFARQFYQVMQCTICSEFLGRQGYQCSSCNNTIHPRCYNRVVTKCITLDSMADASDKNTGQLLKYKIPHRWDAAVNIGASWCSHCGYILPPGKKVHRCSECNKSSHRECSPMVPCFCGLDPIMADTLMAAFEAHEQKLHQKELEDAAQGHREAPVFEQADMSQQKAALEPSTPASAVPPAKLPTVVSPPQPAPPNARVSLPPPPKGRDSTVSVAPSITTPSRVAVTSDKKMSSAILRDVTLDDFHFIAVLGRGAFGKVMLATEKSTNQLFAIKALKKEFIIQNDDVKSVKLEKFIFQAASQHHHPFLVNLHSAFDTAARIYFVMEYVAGGDLMCHIQEKKRFHQGRARFYACEVLTAIQYFHANGIIYRDLKLDNILLCSDGHIKVADYGICKASMPFGATTATFCGTPDYMAPEILMNRRYGVGVDWWSFGVLIYVMLYPFHGEDENDILEAILADAIEYPSNLPRVTLNLLQSLMHKNPARRLGASRDDAEEVKRHPYFTGVDWEALLRRETTPPFVPVIANAKDVSNFDKEFTSEPPVLTPINSVLSEVEQKEFSDFGYIADWAFQARVLSAAHK
ncbi:Serine/threonine kinase [Kappamyces sp. JEL0829]|nr:Serine/threonine kinase [Kappamyces sp. JEL0829]